MCTAIIKASNPKRLSINSTSKFFEEEEEEVGVGRVVGVLLTEVVEAGARAEGGVKGE